MDTTKVCNGCKEEKLLVEYNRDKSKKDGYQTRCRACKQVSDNAWRQENKDSVNAKSKAWRKVNRQRAQENIKRWQEENPERYREIQRKHWRKSYEKNKFKKLVSGAIKRSLKGIWKSKAIFERLGYTVDQLKEHLESKFTEGMTWENHGEWHIDHITPQSWLPFSSIEDENFIKCWALSNLQPLWAKDNISKGNRYEG
jgi:hypothetical protein